MSRVEVRLPALGADMESGRLTQWLKAPGEHVRHGEALAIIETAKGLIDLESFWDGRIEELVAQPGTELPVGAVLARLACDTAAAPGAPAPAAAPTPTSNAGVPAGAMAPPLAGSGTPMRPVEGAGAIGGAGARQRVSPAARRRAHELGLDLAAIAGSGPDGLIRLQDVEAGAKTASPGAASAPVAPPSPAAPPPAALPASPSSPRTMREAIGAAMSRSKREIPHYYLSQSVDFTPARDWLAAVNAAVPVAERLLDTVLLIRAIALAATDVPGFNGHYREGAFIPSSQVNVGTAIALRGGGLVAPALLEAERKDPRTLMREMSDLVSRVRTGRMRSGELTAGTITLTALGAEGAEALWPIINPPQVAIIGSGAPAERPWVVNGALVVRTVITLTVAADHRVTDGRAGARFLRRVGELLATPERL